MAITTVADMKVYEAQFQSGLVETLQQNTNAFNAASNGAIVLRSAEVKGNFQQSAFYAKTSGIISRQDLTSTSALTPVKIAQEENVAVKLHRKAAVDLTQKAAKMVGVTLDEFIFAFGQDYAKDMQADMLNMALLAARVALANESSVTNDITGETTKSISHKALLQTLAKFGDAASNIAAWVMHSQQYYELGIQGITDNVTGVTDGIIRRVDVPGLGRPILVTDSASLIDSSDYFVLGLAAGGIDVNQSEAVNTVIQDVTGLEQLVVRHQSEYAYNLGVKGFKWDISNGGANPDDSAVGTAGNWDKVASDSKSLAGVVLQCNAA